MTVFEQIKATLRSRKFWALLTSLITIWGTYFTAPAQMPLLTAVLATVTALSVYSVGVAIEGPGLPIRE